MSGSQFTFIRISCIAAACVVSMAHFGTAYAQQKKPPAPTQQQKEPPREKTFPLNASWTAVSINNRRYTGDRPTMILDSQSRMQGFSGCNTYSATSYATRGQRIAVGPIAFTKRGCSQATLSAERAFLTTLRGSYQWDIQGPLLIIKSSDGELRFERTL